VSLVKRPVFQKEGTEIGLLPPPEIQIDRRWQLFAPKGTRSPFRGLFRGTRSTETRSFMVQFCLSRGRWAIESQRFYEANDGSG
jgi:hypothetical protein